MTDRQWKGRAKIGCGLGENGAEDADVAAAPAPSAAIAATRVCGTCGAADAVILVPPRPSLEAVNVVEV